MSVKVQIDGVMVLTGVAVGAVGLAWWNRQSLVNLVNPTHQDNIVNRAAKEVVGEDNLRGFFDRVFGAVDLVNPLNESDDYARQVWGLDPI
ncbi:hypothetical protein [Microbulbifer sp. PSTR4-B]|uniref:hypothetical protein n=1 Tax=Microbulbifer sp. PSTR4-B TaxID=3243396 RepID=UPI0040391BC4